MSKHEYAVKSIKKICIQIDKKEMKYCSFSAPYFLKRRANIFFYAECAVPYFRRAVRFSVVNACINGMRIIGSHVPKRITEG